MSKNVPVIILTFILLGIAAFAIIQFNTNRGQQNKIETLKENLKNTAHELDSTKEVYEKTIEEKLVLEEQNLVLRDSIRKLNNLIVRLRNIITEKEQEIADLNKNIDRRSYSYQKLKEKISALYRKEKVNKKKVDQLEREKAKLKKEIERLARKQETIIAEKGVTTEDLLDYQASKAAFERIKDIAENTIVRYKTISPKRSKYGRDITRIDKNSSNWNFTIIELKLDHPDISSIVDEKFILKIRDEDNHKNMTYFSENPNFPSDYIDGIPFKFDGNLVEIIFHNAQQKKGKNYSINVYIVKDDGEYLLNKSPFPIFKEQMLTLKNK